MNCLSIIEASSEATHITGAKALCQVGCYSARETLCQIIHYWWGIVIWSRPLFWLRSILSGKPPLWWRIFGNCV